MSKYILRYYVDVTGHVFWKIRTEPKRGQPTPLCKSKLYKNLSAAKTAARNFLLAIQHYQIEEKPKPITVALKRRPQNEKT